MQRALIIVAVLALLGAAVYLIFFNDSAGVTVAPGGNTSLPLAEQGAPATGSSEVTLPSDTASAAAVVSPRLVQISVGPVVSGEAVASKPGNASTSPEAIVSFIERTSGNVFSYSTLTKTLTRTSNKTIPGIQSASWLPDGSVAFVRYLSGTNFSTINTYALPASGIGGFFLPQNLADINVASTSLLTLASGVNGSTASTARTDGTRSTSAFSTPLSALRVSFAGKTQYLAVTKASAALPGSAFLVEAATGRFSRIAGPLPGLTALASPSGKWILVSYVNGRTLQMQLVNTATSETLPLPIATIAEKCVWAADDSALYCGVPVNPNTSMTYPDDWYQGAAHFSDRIWKIQVAGRYAQLVLDFSKETESALDAEALAVDPKSVALVFINKNDGSLWSYSL